MVLNHQSQCGCGGKRHELRFDRASATWWWGDRRRPTPARRPSRPRRKQAMARFRKDAPLYRPRCPCGCGRHCAGSIVMRPFAAEACIGRWRRMKAMQKRRAEARRKAKRKARRPPKSLSR